MDKWTVDHNGLGLRWTDVDRNDRTVHEWSLKSSFCPLVSIFVSESDLVPLLNYFSKDQGHRNTIILPSNAWIEHGWDCQTYQNAFYDDLIKTMTTHGITR